MSRPLPSGDPSKLGPFRLSARLAETPAGIVFLGEDEDGVQASVAVLTRGAAQDAAARDRFRAAILSAVPGPGRAPQMAPGDPAPVVAAQPEGPAPWVATLYEPGESGRSVRPGAERFLDPVLLTGQVWDRWAGRRHGPNFQPYWSGSGGPAVAPPRPVPVPPPAPRSDRGLAAAILTLTALLGLLAVLMLLLFACQPEVSDPPRDPPTETYQAPTPPSPSRTLSPSPSPTPSPAPTPGPGDPGEPGGGGGPL